MYQFFVEDDQIGEDTIRVMGSDVNHMKNVLRMKPGERVRISNQSGRDFLCSVETLSDDELIEYMVSFFDNEAGGSAEYLAEVSLSELLVASAVRRECR